MYAQFAFAQNNDPFQTHTANDILQQFKNQRVLWTTNIWVYANTLFGILAVIEFAWSAAVMLLEKTDLQSWTSALIRKLMWIGAFYALLINGRTWIPAIIDSFSQIGANAAGMAGPLSPGDVFVQGLNIAGALIDAGSTSAFFTNPGTSLALVLCALLIVVSYIIITLNFIVTMVESYLVVSVGFIFLGFGGSRWTVPYTERYIGLAISIGIKIVLLYCLITAGMNLGVVWIDEAQTVGTAAHPNMVAFDVMGAALIFMMCCWQIPKLFAAVLGGAPALAGGDLWGTGLAVVGAGIAAASLASGAVAGSSALAGTGSAATAGNSSFGIGSSVAGISTGGSTGGPAGGSVPPPTSPPRGPSTNDSGPRRQPDPPRTSGNGLLGPDSTFTSPTRADVEAPGTGGGRQQDSTSAALAGVGGEPLAGSGFEGQTIARGFKPSVLGTTFVGPGICVGLDPAASRGDAEPNSRAAIDPANSSAMASEINSVGSAGSAERQPLPTGEGAGIRAAAPSRRNSLNNASRRLDRMRYRLSRVRLPSDAAPHQSPPRMPVEHED
jgi:type IV secretion system protein TrbL